MLSCQQTQNVIDGKKRIILNPQESQKKDFETVTFEENEVYGIDILISSGEDGKVNFSFLYEFSSVIHTVSIFSVQAVRREAYCVPA